ncbi:PRP3-domain-containing protein [Rickenella mellea]|uniref:PRP3-domain-containing protein n=1 Tax=Rickenella mellea TaxID=50990 RepID=A0A4Y7PTF1_9AGAM|nr:PRP3-domain-containing protein [Rickenella mellea]
MSKRQHDVDEQASSKKLKSDPTSSNGPKPSSSTSADALIAQKRAEIAAKMALMMGKQKQPGSGFASGPTPATATAVPIVSPAPKIPTVAASQLLNTPAAADDLARRVAEAKRRVADAQSKIAVQDNPYLSMPQTGKKKNVAPEPAPQGAGLKMAAHPLLLDTSTPAPQSKKDRYKPMQPKFASVKANVRNTPISTPPPISTPTPLSSTPLSSSAGEAKVNPYAAKDLASGSFEGAAPKERTARGFRFNQKGKYIAIAGQVRQAAQLEELKQRIAESARKAGLDGEFESVEKSIRRDPPPEAEWWDAALLPRKTYDDLAYGFDALNIRNADSPINIYVQHPIPIPAPGDKNKQELKPLKLTKKEEKKLRKRTRQNELQDKRDRIRMGLVPPDAPKVRLANLMKVLTSDAVQDPTRVEARVRREVAMRKHNHEKMNSERKLTGEQRREKMERKMEGEERKGLVGAVFKVKTLSDPAHRFKVRKNAEQMHLTGIVIFHPAFSMVYVEGAAKMVRNYKRLLLHRMQWTEAARARGAEDAELELDSSPPSPSANAPPDTTAASTSASASTTVPGADGEFGTVSLAENRCDLVWEGALRERVFKGFRPRSCPTDAAAREALGVKMAGYWDTTKNWRGEEEELV